MNPDELCVCFHPASDHPEPEEKCIHGCDCEKLAQEAVKDKGIGLMVKLWAMEHIESDGKGNFRLID